LEENYNIDENYVVTASGDTDSYFMNLEAVTKDFIKRYGWDDNLNKWTDEQKAVNKRIVATIAKILPLYIAGHSEQGYELAAREIVKAIVNGKINNLKVEY
jgi:hypothetical protein